MDQRAGVEKCVCTHTHMHKDLCTEGLAAKCKVPI